MIECKDCGKEARPVKACATKVCPGPRCLACWRTEKKRRSAASHGKKIEALYGITEKQYQALYKAQGERCALCLTATGKRKRLAVDHDHRTGRVRGLLCGPCNKDILGRSGDDTAFFQRCIDYLIDPPARKVLNDRTTTTMVQEQET